MWNQTKSELREFARRDEIHPNNVKKNERKKREIKKSAKNIKREKKIEK